MGKRISRREAIARADVNVSAITDGTGTTNFPYPEALETVAHSEGVYGCTGILRRGATSGLRYFAGPYSSDCEGHALRQQMGNRERAVVEQLDRVEVVEQAEHGRRCVLRFVAFDGSAFTVATFDRGHSWAICG